MTAVTNSENQTPATGAGRGLLEGALVCDAVSAFYGRIQVVYDVSLSVAPGECLAVLGANGAGKTSLQGAIAGTVRGTGRMLFAGKDLSSLSAHRRARRAFPMCRRRAAIFSSP
jgi:branched-chain amino acid transport system ATP-binding protein